MEQNNQVKFKGGHFHLLQLPLLKKKKSENQMEKYEGYRQKNHD